jgi:hypothetical protein
MAKEKGRYFTLTYRITEDNGLYSGFCEELGLATCADNLDESKRRLDKISLMAIDTATKNGEIDEYLKSKNIVMHTTKKDLAPAKCSVCIQPDEWISSQMREVVLAGA